MGDDKRRLLWHGMALFLLGLITGLLEQHLHNPRMGLAAHLEGVMNGILLVALGAIWMEVRLLPSLKTAVFWILLAGTYGNWAVTCLAAMLGTAALSPITAVGYSAPALQEAVVTGGFVAVGILMLGAAGLVLWGLRKNAGR